MQLIRKLHMMITHQQKLLQQLHQHKLMLLQHPLLHLLKRRPLQHQFQHLLKPRQLQHPLQLIMHQRLLVQQLTRMSLTQFQLSLKSVSV
jgi:hypothetical protein